MLASLRYSQSDSVSHSWGKSKPTVPSRIMPDITADATDIRISERLLVAYNKAIKDRYALECNDIWTNIRERQPTFFRALQSNDPLLLASYLCNMSRQDATMGTTQGYQEYTNIKFNPLRRRLIALITKDKLVSLAEAVGAMPCENPEQGSWGKSIHTPIDKIVTLIEQKINLDITPPDIEGGLFKICGKSVNFHDRDLHSIYTAWYIGTLLKEEGGAVCEIGAGTGRLAYWYWRMALGSYSIIDLPHINVIQGFYLLKALPDAEIRLYGESKDPGNDKNEIRILPDHAINNLKHQEFNLILNQDAFPEIHSEVVRDYLVSIRELSSKYFLSINHESSPKFSGFVQNNVQELIDEVGGYTLVYRMPYWMRRGYVIELYKV